MTLNDLLVIMQNRALNLAEAKKHATINGDVHRIIEIDADIITTNISIDQLKAVLGIS